MNGAPLRHYHGTTAAKSQFSATEVRSRCGKLCQSLTAAALRHYCGKSGPNARAYTQGLYPSPEGERVINSRPEVGAGSC
jgi:hypothetical protein